MCLYKCLGTRCTNREECEQELERDGRCVALGVVPREEVSSGS